jgi:hypothetical protein
VTPLRRMTKSFGGCVFQTGSWGSIASTLWAMETVATPERKQV